MTYHEPTRVPAQRSTAVGVTAALPLAVIGEDATVTVPAVLRYHAHDPYAVHLDIHTGEPEPITWFFARELLREGLCRTAGQGDVTVRPGADGARTGHLFLTLTGPQSAALLRARTIDVAHFLGRSEELVPPGSEHERLDLDALADRLLGRDLD
ncbi:SsgA family sporulation/cell division regulator [Kitasatospora sp. NPDC101183]|uniref:SsgA family sporulation/cell division regulator n=1 Tax=Kitasatospora sp. NPDC101183 TaxID=3364100 RepID=UPI0038013740